MRDALGRDRPRIGAGGAPLDKTRVEVIDGHEAAFIDADETGPSGISLPATGEVAGGAIQRLLGGPPGGAETEHPWTREQAAMQKPVFQRLAALSGRPPEALGVIGPGDTIRGHMILIDLNTGEKVRAMDGHRVNEGELYANARNLPEALTAGDMVTRVIGGG